MLGNPLSTTLAFHMIGREREREGEREREREREGEREREREGERERSFNFSQSHCQLFINQIVLLTHSLIKLQHISQHITSTMAELNTTTIIIASYYTCSKDSALPIIITQHPLPNDGKYSLQVLANITKNIYIYKFASNSWAKWRHNQENYLVVIF